MTGEKNNEENRASRSGPIVRAATGGLVGATAGYLSAPENRKRLKTAVSKEVLKEKGANLGTVTKDKLGDIKDVGKEKSSKAYQSLKSSSSNMLHKDSSKGDSTGKADTELVQENDEEEEMSDTGKNDAGYEEVKEENDKLKNRLEGLEEKMDQLLAATLADDEAEEAQKASDESDDEETSKQPEKEEAEAASFGEEEDEDETSQPKTSSKKNKTKTDEAKQDGKQGKKNDNKKSGSSASSPKTKSKKDDDNEEEELAISSDDDTSS